MGISLNTVKRAITKLKDTKLLKVIGKERKGKTARLYLITFRPDYWEWIPGVEELLERAVDEDDEDEQDGE